MDKIFKELCKEVAEELDIDKQLVLDVIKHYENDIKIRIRETDEDDVPLYDKIFLYRFGTISKRRNLNYKHHESKGYNTSNE